MVDSDMTVVSEIRGNLIVQVRPQRRGRHGRYGEGRGTGPEEAGRGAPHVFTGSVERTLAHIEESIQNRVSEGYLRWYAIKIFEWDEKVLEELNLSADLKAHLEQHITDCETELDDDAESIITNQRYSYISGVVSKAVRKKAAKHSLSVSDKIDQIVTNRVLALPIFAAIMFCIYAIAMGGWAISIGTMGTDGANDVLFGEWVPGVMASRTIEQDRNQKMTIMTTGFIPCGAKMPIIGLFARAVSGESPWVATSAFFIGIAAVVISGIMLEVHRSLVPPELWL